MPRAYRQLDLDERHTIFRLLNAKVLVSIIARQHGRYRPTIRSEVRRTAHARTRPSCGLPSNGYRV